MDVTKPHKFMGFGAMYVSKPYKFIGFGAMDGIHTGKLRGTKREKLACELYHMETLISDCIFYVRCTVVRKQREPRSAETKLCNSHVYPPLLSCNALPMQALDLAHTVSSKPY